MKKKLKVKRLRKRDGIITCTHIMGAWDIKRAIEVALTGKHSIAFLGAKGCGKTIFSDFIYKLNPNLSVYEAQLCSCGNFGSRVRPCNCTITQIKRFRKRKSFQECLNAEMIMECVQLREQELKDKRPWTFKLKEIEECQKCWKFEKEAEELLGLAIEQAGLNMHQRKALYEIAKTIAFMDSELAVKAHHAAEAIQYQLPRRTF